MVGPIDAGWFAARLRRALALREALFDAPFYRLVHAEADGLPGVIVDRFGDAAVIQPNAAWAELRLEMLAEALRAVTGVTTVVKNGGGRTRGLEGLPDETVVLSGALDGPLAVPMNGATYFADLLGGQKTGIFYDQRPNHAFAARLGRGRAVLDVFSHIGGFGLAALAAGAASALAVDASAPALELGGPRGGGGRRLARFAVRRGDAFETLAAMAEEGARFGLVACDPPAFAPNRAALEAGLRAYERVARLAAALVEPDGFLVLCSCSHAADLARFREASLRGVGRAGRAAQIVHVGGAGPDHPVHPHLAEFRLSQGAVPEAGMRVVLDACVLFPTVLRELLLGVAATGAFAPVWSARILEEWARATRRLPEGAEAVARAEIALMRAAWPDAEAAVDPDLVASLSLPDPGRPARARRGDRRRRRRPADGEPGGLSRPGAGAPRRAAARAGRVPDRAGDGGPRRRRRRRAGARAHRGGVGQALALRPLLKRAGLPRLGKALAADAMTLGEVRP